MMPKVIVCLAREDRKDFLPGFTRQLLRSGLHAQVEAWELKPRDSLIDRIFQEGIGQACALVAVMSGISLAMDWVREASCDEFIRRTSGRLIPVALGGCEIPAPLRGLACTSIQDRLSAAVAAYSAQPSWRIGRPKQSKKIADLDGTGSLMLALSCEAAMESGSRFIRPAELPVKSGGIFLSPEDIEDALEMLDRDGYIRLFCAMSTGHCHYHITLKGFEAYAAECLPDYRARVEAIACSAYSTRNSCELSRELGEPQMLVDHVLDTLEHRGYLKLARLIDGPSVIYDISPELLTRAASFMPLPHNPSETRPAK